MATTLALTNEEAGVLLSILEEAHRVRQIEVHRTDSLDYKKQVQHEDDVLQSLIGKVRQIAARPTA